MKNLSEKGHAELVSKIDPFLLDKPDPSYSIKPAYTELHTFCDASVQGIATVLYLKITQPSGQPVCKIALSHVTRIPCRELCAAALAVANTDMILNERVVHPNIVV